MRPIAVTTSGTPNASQIVWTLAWPAVALNSLQVVNQLLDRLFLGSLDDSALTAHGAAINVLFLMFSIAISFGTGITAIVSRAFGAERPAEYRRAHRQGFRLAIVAGFICMAVTALLAEPASIALIRADNPDAIREMTAFVRMYAIGLPAVFVIQSLAGALRGVGDTKSPMVISGVQILLHIVLNYMLIFPARNLGGVTLPGAGLGLAGAGLAISLSSILAMLAYVPYVSRTPLGGVQRLALPGWPWVKRIMAIAIPAGVMSILRVFSLTAFSLAVKLVENGSEATAAMSVAFAIESVMFMPAFGLSAAAGALVGQSLGMGDPDRASRLAWTAAHWSAAVTIVLCGPVFLLAQPIAHGMLPGKPLIEREAVSLIQWLCATEIFFSYAMVLMGAMQGAGDTKRPLWIAIWSLWGLRVPLAFILTLPTGFAILGPISLPWGAAMGSTGAWLAMSATQFVQGALSIWAWRAGKWRTAKV
ncbi:MAG: MATE family efflux transporter [Fimbriimonadaceae bacterium]|nr:MATE family efflux transporter [Fimbriimonadaceae bacterium]